MRISGEEIDSAPLFRIGLPPDSSTPLMVEGPGNGGVPVAVAVLSQGRSVVLFQEPLCIQLLDSNEKYLGDPIPVLENVPPELHPKLFLLSEDTLLLSGNRTAFRVRLDGTTIDAIPISGSVIGTLRDGSWVTEHWETRGRPQPTGQFAESTSIQMFLDLVVPMGAPPSYQDNPVRRLFEGAAWFLAPPAPPAPLPWHPRPSGVVAGGRLWISPAGNAELVELSHQGNLIGRLAWDASPSLSAEELRYWTQLVDDTGPQVVGNGDGAGRGVPGSAKDLEVGGPIRIIDKLVGSPDGTIWVLERRRFGGSADVANDVWLGLSPEGRVLGRIEMPRWTSVLGFTDTHVLIELRKGEVLLVANPFSVGGQGKSPREDGHPQG